MNCLDGVATGPKDARHSYRTIRSLRCCGVDTQRHSYLYGYRPSAQFRHLPKSPVLEALSSPVCTDVCTYVLYVYVVQIYLYFNRMMTICTDLRSCETRTHLSEAGLQSYMLHTIVWRHVVNTHRFLGVR
jgi:hypothetical protein